MCGISGIFNYSKSDIDSERLVLKFTELQKKRGPDNKAIWKSDCGKVVFGHNRLSIIDTSIDANQPFISQDQNYVITFNGEIYNFNEIRKEIENKKIVFRTKSDTEVIIEAYKIWGIDFIKKLRGMYAFAIWDKKNKKIIFGRDPFGIKPLYYLNQNGVFYFASQIKTLLSIDNLSHKISNSGLVSYYLWGHVQEPKTLFKNIKSLKRGTCLTVNREGKKIFYEFANLKNLILNSEKLDLKDEKEKKVYLKNIIEETVSYHQVSDVPRAILLSSGIDSNIILASTNNVNKKDLSALTIDFDYNDNKNETILASESAKLNGIKHIIDKISNYEFENLLKNFFIDMDSPTNDALNNYLISYLAKKNNFKVIISGVGGDEFFLSYPSFKVIPSLKSKMKYVPQFPLLNSFLKNTFYSFLKNKKMKTKYSGIYEYGRKTNSAYLLNRSLFLPFEIQEIISDHQFKEGIDELNYFEESNNEIEKFENDQIAIMYYEIKYYLTSKLLRDCDWASMSHSVELRTPFVDWFFFKKIIPYIKSNIKFNKSSLVDSYQHCLPSKLKTRKKTGFNVPHENYLKIMSVKREYANPIRDWSLFSLKNYLNHNKLL